VSPTVGWLCDGQRAEVKRVGGVVREVRVGGADAAIAREWGSALMRQRISRQRKVPVPGAFRL